MLPELLKSSLAEFSSLISSDALASHEQEVPLRGWRDELGRLRVWAANIGAHKTGQSSLDYRLRDSSHIKNQTVRLLGRLKELLAELTVVLEEDADDGAQEDGLEGFDEDLDEIDDTTEIQKIHKSLVETITNLFKLSMVIRKPAHHDRLIGTDKLDAEPFRFWTRQHISHKYPLADEPVIDRISSAMARQRAILKYRERHHAKLSQGINPEKGDEKTEELSETIVSTTFQEIGVFNDVASDAGVSETSYAATLLGGEGKMTIPPMPKEGTNRTPFECPYCFFILTIRDSREWARHVFRDLMPYVCIYPLCPTPNKLYESRRQWFHHIRETHELEPAAGGAYVCSICKQGSISEVIFERHVGRHLEESALFVLPHTTSDDGVELESDEDEGSQNKEESVSETAKPDHADDCQQNEQDATLKAAAEDQGRSDLISQTNRQNEYFVPEDGISREVIEADICRYLGNDALLRSGNYKGHRGFYIRAYRNLTSEMITDLKADSARWEADVSRQADLGYPPASYRYSAPYSRSPAKTHN